MGRILFHKSDTKEEKWIKYCERIYYGSIQIKPIASGQALNQYQWTEMHMVNHQRFESDFGGKVFFVYSTKSATGKKIIYNTEVIKQIREEIQRIENL